jgi:hypothetical protein
MNAAPNARDELETIDIIAEHGLTDVARDRVRDALKVIRTQLNAQPANGHDREPPSSKAEPLRLQTLSEFVTRPVVSNQIRGIDPGQAIIVFFGPPKEGKTFSVCDLGMHAAHGLDWHGCRIGRALRVAYLIGEGINGFRLPLKAWLEQHDALEQAGDFRIFPAPLSLPDCIDSVIEMLASFKPDIIVTDTLNAFFGAGDESKTQDMTVFCTAVRRLRDTLKSSVYVIHHTGQGEQGRERGSIVLRATADVLVQIAKDSGGSGLVGFQVIAGRDIEAMPNPISLRLNRYETEWSDDDGQPMATCIVTAADQHVTLPGRGARPLGTAQTTVLAVARELARSQGPGPKGETLVARHEISRIALTRGVKKSSISSAWEPLVQRGYLRLVEPGAVMVRTCVASDALVRSTRSIDLSYLRTSTRGSEIATSYGSYLRTGRRMRSIRRSAPAVKGSTVVDPEQSKYLRG